MATSVLNSFSPNQSATINSLYNAWLASPYSNNPNVLYQAIGVANGEGNTARGSNGLLGMLAGNSNADGAGRTAYGPFQYNFNPSGGSLGNTISNYYGVSNPGQLTLDQQSQFTINTIGSGSNGGINNWMSVGDSGGVNNITAAGQSTFNNAQSQGIIGSSSAAGGVTASSFDSASGLTSPPSEAQRVSEFTDRTAAPRPKAMLAIGQGSITTVSNPTAAHR